MTILKFCARFELALNVEHEEEQATSSDLGFDAWTGMGIVKAKVLAASLNASVVGPTASSAVAARLRALQSPINALAAG
jgi:hypothetical protein